MTSPTEQEPKRDDKGKFLPGFSGNPGGRPKRKIVTERIVDQLEKVNPDDEHGRTNLQIIVDSLIGNANKGDLGSIKEIIDRAEGRPVSSVEVTGEDGGPIEVDAIAKLDARISALSQRRKETKGNPKP